MYASYYTLVPCLLVMSLFVQNWQQYTVTHQEAGTSTHFIYVSFITITPINIPSHIHTESIYISAEPLHSQKPAAWNFLSYRQGPAQVIRGDIVTAL